jgi:drug/metabolite transporter (DMT)-like permease
VVVAVVFAAAAGACFAAANLVQQRASRSREPGPLSPRLILALVRNRAWLIGFGLVATSYGLQSVALSFGPLSLVQSIMVSEILFAAPVSARLHHQHVGSRLVVGAAAVAAGLPLALWRPRRAGATRWPRARRGWRRWPPSARSPPSAS